MIERTADGAAGARIEFRLRANRSVSAAGLLAFFAVLAGWSIAVAAFSAGQGNVFAPFFAAAELSVVAVCLRLVWRQLGRVEWIALAPEAVRVARDDGSAVAVEVGALLADAECVELEAQLKQALARCRAAGERGTDG